MYITSASVTYYLCLNGAGRLAKKAKDASQKTPSGGSGVAGDGVDHVGGNRSGHRPLDDGAEEAAAEAVSEEPPATKSPRHL